MVENTPEAMESLYQDSTDRKAAFARLMAARGAREVLELGVWRGEFAAHVLAACPAIRRYYMLDPWRPLAQWNKPFNIADKDFEAAMARALAATEFAADRRIVLRGTTTERINDIPDASLDAAYVDGDHTFRGVTIDLVAIWPKLRPGGVIVGDDFTPSVWQHDIAFEPSGAFPLAVYFAEAVGAPIAALRWRQFAIIKPADGQRAFRFLDASARYSDTQMLPHFREFVRRKRKKRMRRMAGAARRQAGQE